MKKIYSILAVCAALAIQAQSPIEVRDIDNGLALVSNNQVFNKTTTANGTEFPFHFQIKNLSANTLTFQVRKYEDLLNTVGASSAQAYFCFNTFCYIPTVMNATIQLSAGATFSFIPKLDEATAVGESNIRYKISQSTNDFFVVLKYNTPVGVKENAELFTHASSAYPNPTDSKCAIDLTLNQDALGTTLRVYNSLGAVVLSKEVDLKKGKNSVNVDSDELSSGIYFIRLNNGENRITRKITINK